MPNLMDADDFFSNHLLKEKYFEFPDALRSAAVATAAMDITAVLKIDALPEPAPEMLKCAIFEQAIYLLLNPNMLAGDTENRNSGIVAPRAQPFLNAFLTGAAEEENTDESAPPVIHLQRG